MKSSDVLDIFETYPADHPIKEMLKYQDMIFPRTYITKLIRSILRLGEIEYDVALDFLKNKIRAKSGDSVDFHGFMSSICELSIMDTMLSKIDDKTTFEYEPTPVPGSNKNPEFSLEINNIKYFVEVKAPNLENYYEKITDKIKKDGVVYRFDSRITPLTEEHKRDHVLSTDSRVKDFLVDANSKFQNGDKRHYNILFICWSDETDQPCTALKHPMHGLLTENSWFKDKNGKPNKFENIDIIFISDLLQNHRVHMSSGDIPVPNSISGVPYFDTFQYTGIIPDPFNLVSSRNVIIETDVPESIIFPLPISTDDNPVYVITEECVSKNCPEFKYSFK